MGEGKSLRGPCAHCVRRGTALRMGFRTARSAPQEPGATWSV